MVSGKGLLGLLGAKIYSIIQSARYACEALTFVSWRRRHLCYLILGFYSVRQNVVGLVVGFETNRVDNIFLWIKIIRLIQVAPKGPLGPKPYSSELDIVAFGSSSCWPAWSPLRVPFGA